MNTIVIKNLHAKNSISKEAQAFHAAAENEKRVGRRLRLLDDIKEKANGNKPAESLLDRVSNTVTSIFSTDVKKDKKDKKDDKKKHKKMATLIAQMASAAPAPVAKYPFELSDKVRETAVSKVSNDLSEHGAINFGLFAEYFKGDNTIKTMLADSGDIAVNMGVLASKIKEDSRNKDDANVADQARIFLNKKAVKKLLDTATSANEEHLVEVTDMLTSDRSDKEKLDLLFKYLEANLSLTNEFVPANYAKIAYGSVGFRRVVIAMALSVFCSSEEIRAMVNDPALSEIGKLSISASCIVGAACSLHYGAVIGEICLKFNELGFEKPEDFFAKILSEATKADGMVRREDVKATEASTQAVLADLHAKAADADKNDKPGEATAMAAAVVKAVGGKKASQAGK